MNYVEVVREAWTLVRRNGALPAFSLIQAAYAAVMGLAVMASLVPVFLAITLTGAQDSPMDGESLAILGFLEQHSTAFMVLVVALAVSALAIAVIDVAAQAGLVDQAVAASYGHKARFTPGLSKGMSRWWRTATLLAIPALPGLLYMLVYVVIMYVAFVIPAMRGADLDSARMAATSTALSLASTLISLAAIPLGILATLGLRFAIADDHPWGESLKRSWALIKGQFVDILLSYLVMMAFTIVAILVLEFLIALVAVAFVALVVALATAASATAAWAAGVTGALVVMIAFVIMAGVLGAVVSSFWTVLWLRLTRQPQAVFPTQPPVPALDWSEQ